MTEAWVSAVLAFGLLTWGFHSMDGIALVFGVIWTINCWLAQKKAFAKEEHDREHADGTDRGNGEGPGQERKD